MVLFVLFWISCLLSQTSAAPKIRLGNSTLVGRDVTLLKQDFFGGIPFAEPPLGNLRFRPAVLKTSPDVDEFDASNFGLACFQQASVTVLRLKHLY